MTLGGWVFLVSVSLPLVACAQAGAYTIKDSGAAFPFPNPGLLPNIIAWLDNTHVAVNGELIDPQRSKQLAGDSSAREQGLYVWDTSTSTVTRHTKLEHQTSLCRYNDVLSFLQKGIIITWKPGQPQEKRPLPHPFWFNPFSCRYYDSPPLWVVQGRYTTPLLEEHGYLALEPVGNDVPSEKQKFRKMLYLPGNTNGIELALPGGLAIGALTYAPFRNAYLIPSDRYRDPATNQVEQSTSWPKGKPFPVWWLTPDGTVTEEVLAYHQFMSRASSRGFLPVKGGVFAWSHASVSLTNTGDAGGYLFRDGTVHKLIAGFLHSPVVSPDGCGVAFVHDPHDTKVPNERADRITVKVIDFCDGGIHE